MISTEFIGVIAGISGEVIVNEIKKLGYKTFVISGRENDSGMNLSDKNLVIDLKEKEKIYNELKKNNVNKIIFGTGHILGFELANYLIEKNIKCSINPKSSLIAKDKYLYKEELIKNNILTPLFVKLEKDSNYDINQISEKIGYPCVIKSTIDVMYPRKANTKTELKEYIDILQEKNSPIIIEQFIEGIDTTVPVISNFKEIRSVLVSYYSKADSCKLIGFEERKEKNKLSPEVEQKLLRFSEDVIRKTNILGMARLDIIVDKNEDFYVLECNSVMVTGVHPNQIEYGREFLEKENINFAKLTVENAFKIFEKE